MKKKSPQYFTGGKIKPKISTELIAKKLVWFVLN